MVVRWVAAGVLEGVKGFRRLKGHKAMPRSSWQHSVRVLSSSIS
jgi:hypothetical protein